jgi:hypothetical protein
LLQEPLFNLTTDQENINNNTLNPLAYISGLMASINLLAAGPALYRKENFIGRMEAIDFIDFHIIDRAEILIQQTEQSHELAILKGRAEKIIAELESINLLLFADIRKQIVAGRCRGNPFKQLIMSYAGYHPFFGGQHNNVGYDDLDVLINGILHSGTMPKQTLHLEPGMIYYQKTPARIVFELAEQLQFTNDDDVFIDLGSGLGQAAILVNLLTGVKACGIEFEPAFCDYARSCASQLCLSNVTFINTDARKADLTKGTIFFMYTPFEGKMLQEVLAILQKETLSRKISVLTYGPCTAQVASQSWLKFSELTKPEVYQLSVFSSM